MRFREKEELPIIETQMKETTVSKEQVKKSLKDKAADVVYVVCRNELYGIVSIGDVLRGNQRIIINTQFSFIRYKNVLTARRIFKDKAKINMIPVVDDSGELIGDYSRFDLWNDNLFHDVNIDILKWYTKAYARNLFVVKPLSDKTSDFDKMLCFLGENQIENTVCTREDVVERYLNENTALFLFVDNDELCAAQACSGRTPKQEQIFYTYESLFKIVGTKTDVENLKLIVDILKAQGVFCYTVSNREIDGLWYKDFARRQLERLSADVKENNAKVISKKYAKDFYEDIYTEDLWYEVNNTPIQYRLVNGFNRPIDRESENIRVYEGVRNTAYQPEIYERTIYFFGSCLFLGGRVSDNATIESYLQKLVNKDGYKYRVVNCGAVTGTKIDIPRIMEQQYRKGDMVILYTYANYWEDVPDVNILQIAEEVNFPNEWTTDCFLEHCNHRANKLWAERIFKLIKPMLQHENAALPISPDDIQEKYIYNSYIRKYFDDINYYKNKQVGAIVMNCNPFTKGHRYLIEYACKQVECLIVFVVEEDKSVFPFEERLELVKQGTCDLKQVTVVPSGGFILSQTLFPEYFIKQMDENIVENTENDIRLFANFIAKILNIKYRFVGMEKDDAVTNEYNNAMKRILPTKGIEVVEIERKSSGNSSISASRVREYMENQEFEKAYELVPKTTQKLLSTKYE